ncbi:MFS transporter [Acetobacteraceae bacterium H6797]|nr:MFS transporter [Acetobacteraceae bacterium H6797]
MALPGLAMPGLGLAISLGIAQIVAWGVTYYLPATLSAPMAEGLGLPITVPFTGAAVTFVLTALLAPVIGRWMDRHGARPVLMLSCLFIALGLVLQGAAPNLAVLVLSWLVTGIGTSMGLTQAALTALAQFAGGAAKRLMTVLMLLAGLSVSVAWLGTQALIDALGWRGCCFVLAALQCAICLPIYAMVPRRPKEARQVEVGAPRPALAEVPRFDRDQFLISLGFSLHMAASSGISLHLIAVLGHFGADAAQAVKLSALIGVAQVGTRVLELAFGRLPALVNARFGCALVVPAMGLAYLAPHESPGWMLGACMLALGVTTGIMSVARAAVPLEIWGPARYGTLAGRISAPIMLLMATAPALFAFAIEWLGPGGMPALAAGLSAIGALALCGVSGKPRAAG